MAWNIDRKFIILLIISFPLIYHYWQPYQRGFNCSDKSLQHQFRTIWFKTRYLFLSTFLLPMLIIFMIQPSSSNSTKNLKKFIFGFLFNLNMTEIFKRTFGRLRPHIYDFCHLDRYCPNGTMIDHYIDSFECLNDDYPWYIMNERLSFYSGHSALGAFTGTYLVYFLHKNLFQQQQKQSSTLLMVNNDSSCHSNNKWWLKYRLKLLMEMAIFIIYLIPGFSQYLIEWHFLSDVLTGFTFGTFNALLVQMLIL